MVTIRPFLVKPFPVAVETTLKLFRSNLQQFSEARLQACRNPKSITNNEKTNEIDWQMVHGLPAAKNDLRHEPFCDGADLPGTGGKREL